MTGTPFAQSYFCAMKQNASVDPHHGPSNMRLRCHLPLTVPEECFFRLAGNPKEWEEGKLMIFDDSYEYEAANFSEEDRSMLLFDIWHPDLVPEEIEEVRNMFKKMQKMMEEKKAKEEAKA